MVRMLGPLTLFKSLFTENDDENLANDFEMANLAKMLCDPKEGMKVCCLIDFDVFDIVYISYNILV